MAMTIASKTATVIHSTLHMHCFQPLIRMRSTSVSSVGDDLSIGASHTSIGSPQHLPAGGSHPPFHPHPVPKKPKKKQTIFEAKSWLATPKMAPKFCD
uniref:Uncharacterized protein n=1 Tax=Rhizophora mucronata TaxID=61149 RepID=A0A2P2N000_RHIMU